MHVCLFDIDGTLISTYGAGMRALRAALQQEFGIAEPSPQVQTAGRTDRGIARDFFAAHQLEDSPQNWERFCRAYLELLPGSIQRAQGRVLPGIVALLQKLRARDDVLLGLLTGNVPHGAQVKLKHFELWEFFSFGAFGDAHGHRDDLARQAWQTLRAESPHPLTIERVWVIGDTPGDVRCARAIGARAVAVATGIYSREELVPSEPDLLLDDLSDPEPWLKHWAT